MLFTMDVDIRYSSSHIKNLKLHCYLCSVNKGFIEICCIALYGLQLGKKTRTSMSKLVWSLHSLEIPGEGHLHFAWSSLQYGGHSTCPSF